MAKLCLQLLFADTVRGSMTTRRITVIGRHGVVWSAPTCVCPGLCLLDVNRFGSGSVLLGSARVSIQSGSRIRSWVRSGSVLFGSTIQFGSVEAGPVRFC